METSTQTALTGAGVPMPPFHVAIVGAGPSGCYTAQAVRKLVPTARIAVLDASPTPYGLIRYGIAPDHQGAKAVSRQFERLFRQPDVTFLGNVAVGRDLPLEALLENFDAVVLATGLPTDRPSDAVQDPGARVIGAGALVRLLNSDPDSPLRSRSEALESLGEEVAILGTGNVALDVARLLAKADTDLVASDVDDDALRRLVPDRLKTIHIIGRCAPHLAKWDAAMLKELAEVAEVSLRIDATPFAAGDVASARTAIRVRFRQITNSIACHGERIRVVTHDAADPSTVRHIDVDTVVTALGFEGTPFDAHGVAGRSAPNLFRVGGPATGMLGNVADNRKLAVQTAKDLVEALPDRAHQQRRGVAGLRDALPPRHVDFDGWKRIDEAEVRRARPHRCRTKFTTRKDLLTAAEGSAPAPRPPAAHRPASV